MANLTDISLTDRAVMVPGELLRSLKPYADKRGVTPSELIRQLLAQIVADKMVAAVLDDE